MATRSWPFAGWRATDSTRAHGPTGQSHPLQAADPNHASVTSADFERRSIEQGENRADLSVLEDCCATDYVHHDE
jgi:hypothetical protein